MSIPELQKAAARIAAEAPDSDQCLALSRVVGVALGMATPLQGLGDAIMNSMTRTELIDAINKKDAVYATIDRCNESVLLCVETTVRMFTKAFLFRVEAARGNPLTIGFAQELDTCTAECAALLVPAFRQLLNP